MSRLDTHVRAIAAADRAPAAILAAIADGETAIVCYGDPPPDIHTAFELGSIAKPFTALLLAEMVGCGEVHYDDPIAAYLPPHAVPRHVTEPPVTLTHLATHTGGLPRLPANLYLLALRSWSTNPYARYRLDHLYRATSRLRPDGLCPARGCCISTSAWACSGSCWPTPPVGITGIWSLIASAVRWT